MAIIIFLRLLKLRTFYFSIKAKHNINTLYLIYNSLFYNTKDNINKLLTTIQLFINMSSNLIDFVDETNAEKGELNFLYKFLT